MYARRICRHGDVRAVVDDKRHTVAVANSFCKARKAQVFTAAALFFAQLHQRHAARERFFEDRKKIIVRAAGAVGHKV